MKICIISFDIWGFDNFIKKNLETQNIEAYHISLSKYKYKYKNLFEKISNFNNKLFFNKNVKKINREKFILDTLENLGKFDQILIINPEQISLETHQKIKNSTKRYITFLYDSLDRTSVLNNILDLFDTVFSFDDKDCKEFNFKFITNYIYQDIEEIKQTFDFKAFAIYSEDNRLRTLYKLDDIFKKFDTPSKFLIYTNKLKKVKNTTIHFTNQRISIDEVMKDLEKSEIFIDLIRDNQTGLSFRVFEALAMQRKLITTNKNIKHYDFYNENNILVVDKENPVISDNFLNGTYEKIPENILNKYTLNHWTKTVFNLS